MSYIKVYIFFFIILFITNCANTRLVMEGYKSVVSNNDNKRSTSYKKDLTLEKAHFKVGKPYKIKNITYTPELVASYDKDGIASWYGPKFHNKSTANGEIFDQNKISAAHKTLPLPSIVRVTNLKNNKSLYIRVNDRGPFFNNRIIDLSKQAAIELSIYSKGTENVNVKLVESGPHLLEKKFLNQDYLVKYAINFEASLKADRSNSFQNFFLQVGAFSILSNAKNYAKKIRTALDSESIKVFIKETLVNEKVFKVQIGPFFDPENIKNIYTNLNELGYNSIIITKEENR